MPAEKEHGRVEQDAGGFLHGDTRGSIWGELPCLMDELVSPPLRKWGIGKPDIAGKFKGWEKTLILDAPDALSRRDHQGGRVTPAAGGSPGKRSGRTGFVGRVRGGTSGDRQGSVEHRGGVAAGAALVSHRRPDAVRSPSWQHRVQQWKSKQVECCSLWQS